MTTIATSSLMNTGSGDLLGCRDFVIKVTDAFTSGGWINTNQTGSIVTGSHVAITGASQIIGYQVWAFNDWWATNGNAPVYVKVEYGSIYHTAAQMGLRFTVAFKHDGFGNIGTGTSSSVDVTAYGTTNNSLGFAAGTNSTLYNHKICIISGGDMGAMFKEAADTTACVWISRTQDINGNPTNEGIVIGQFNQLSLVSGQSHLLYSRSFGQVPRYETYWSHLANNRSTSAYNASVGVSMIIPLLAYGFSYPIRQFGFVKSSDFGTGNMTIPMFGSQSTYYVSTAVGTTTNMNGVTGITEVNNTHRFIMRWE